MNWWVWVFVVPGALVLGGVIGAAVLAFYLDPWRRM